MPTDATSARPESQRPPIALPAPLRAGLQLVVGPIASVVSLGRGTQADVWLVRPVRGAPVVVKRPRDAASFGRETEAYRRWGDALAPFVTPLVAVVPPPNGALVLQWVDGTTMLDPTLDADTRRVMHHEAGRFCRALAEVPLAGHDPMPLAAALRARLRRWCQRAHGRLPPATLAAIDARFDPELFVGVQRIAAHRDFSPENWIVVRDPGPRLVVIDFGQARADAPLVDLLKLWDRPWNALPGAREAFFSGLGRSLSDVEERRLKHLALLHGLASAVWGREHNTAAYAVLGDEVLRRVLPLC